MRGGSDAGGSSWEEVGRRIDILVFVGRLDPCCNVLDTVFVHGNTEKSLRGRVRTARCRSRLSAEALSLLRFDDEEASVRGFEDTE